jgi:predicted metal-binding membrane protein
MMLPSLVPMLWRYRKAVGGVGGTRLAGLTALVGAGYFFVWTVLGTLVFPIGVAVSAVVSRQPALARGVPIAVGAVVLMAGALQLTAWKRRRLACRGEVRASDRSCLADFDVAWRHGLRLGVDCAACCAGLMMIPLVIRIMDFQVMSAVAAAITAEGFASADARVARGVGAVCIAAGLVLAVRTAGLSS